MKAQQLQIIDITPENVSRLYDFKNRLTNTLSLRTDTKTIGTMGFLLAEIDAQLSVEMNFDLFDILSLIAKMAELNVSNYAQLKRTMTSMCNQTPEYLSSYTESSKASPQATSYEIECSTYHENELSLLPANIEYSIDCIRERMVHDDVTNEQFRHMAMVAGELIEFYQLAIDEDYTEESDFTPNMKADLNMHMATAFIFTDTES